MCNLLNDHAKASIPRLRYGRSLQKSYQRSLYEDRR